MPRILNDRQCLHLQKECDMTEKPNEEPGCLAQLVGLAVIGVLAALIWFWLFYESPHEKAAKEREQDLRE